MSAAAGPAPAAAVRPTGVPTRSIGNALLWVAVFLGGFVFIEPSPYEFALAAIIPLWMLVGFKVPRAISPLVVLIVLFLTGGILAAPQAQNYEAQPIYVSVTIFLALSAVFFASLTADGTDRMNIVVSGWIAAAIATSLLGIMGYFGLTGELFVRYGRATGGFQDPNVFGPFLIFPFLILARRILTGQGGLFNILYALVIFAGIFLSFSRATWGITLFGALASGALLFTLERSPAMRIRFFAVGAVGIVVIALMIVAALSIPSVAELFEIRAQVVQEYDAGKGGRFGRYAGGFNLMLDHPLGIGAMEFGKLFGEDEHNIWLKVLTSYGWLGFVAFLGLVLWTLIAGFPLLFRASPILAATQIAYIVFVGHILMATIIDIDHWRHLYLLFGILWGAIATDKAMRQRRLAEARHGSTQRVAGGRTSPDGHCAPPAAHL